MNQLLAEVNKAVEALREGKVILYPTDTVWGLGCDATNEAAVERLYSLKQRSSDKPLIILISDISELRRFVKKVPDIAWDLVEFAEKPLTVIYSEGQNVAPSVLGKDGSLSIRLTKDTFCCEVIKRLGKPLTSTSANLSGSTTPVSFVDIPSEVISRADHVVQYRQNEVIVAKPSTLVKLEADGTIKFLRK